MKKISFSPNTEFNAGWIEDPTPAIKNLPEWYKKLKGYADGKHRFTLKKTGTTIKKCVPFFDAISSGYFINLSADVIVDPDSDTGNLIHWKTTSEIVSFHDMEQLGEFNVPNEYYPLAFKWNSWHTVNTPKGYSSFFMHPVNRIDLPFYTLSGVVDTDKYNQTTVLFPFFLKKEFKGLIPRGTPIVQLIPFKRESWKMEMGDPIDNYKAKLERHHSYMVNAYRNISWTKKEYK
jgi:hypothetical protein